MDLELRRGQLVEQRTKDSERGKAANDVAKKAVQQVLDAAVQGRDLPSCVTELLDEAWSRLMVLRFLKEGDQSNAWLSACDLVKDVVWTVSPNDSIDESVDISKAREVLLRKIPQVMTKMRDGLKEISFDEFRAKALFKSLESEHIKTIQSFQQFERVQSTKNADVADCVRSKSAEVNDSGFEKDELNKLGAGAALKEEQDEYISDFMRDTEAMEDDFKSFQALSKSERRSESDEESSEQSASEQNLSSSVTDNVSLSATANDMVVTDIDDADPFVQQVLRLAPGCWFEFKSDEQPERCKLAAIIKATGKYIFVNRSGVKVAEKTKSSLAIELKAGSIQVLNDGLLFDRALESVIGSLRGRNKD